MQNFDEYFPQAPKICYLNHAAVSPWPKCSEEALVNFAKENTFHGAAYYPKWMQVEKQCRERLAKLIGISNSEEIALAKSTSEALSIIAYGLSWQAGDEIIITSHEFPSNRIVWESLGQFGVKLLIADIDEFAPVDAIKSLVTSKTRLISVSSVQYASGIKMDIEALGALCRQQDILFCVDAIQSLGAIPFDQNKVHADFIVADGHKWMMAAEGLALLYVRDSIQDQLKLHQYGWHMIHQRGNYDRTDWEPAHNATRFECGSPNMLGTHVLNASLGFIHEIGIDTISLELKARMDYLENLVRRELPDADILSPGNSETRAGIFTFKPKISDLKALHSTLMEKGVICAYRGGGIRFSPHFYTRPETIERAVSLTKELVR